VQELEGDNTYTIYSTLNASANPNTGDTVTSCGSSSTVTGTDFPIVVTSPPGELRYFFVRVSNTIRGDGPFSALSVPGWAANITVIYNSSDSTDTALAASIKTTLETSLSTSYPTSIYGTQPIWKVTLVPESLVSTTYVALVPLTPTNEQYWRYNIYGAPTIVTPATSVYANANKVRNIVGTTVAARGVVGIGYGGTRLLDYVNSYWTTWGLAGQQPTNLGYMNSAGFSDTTLNGYTWTISNTVWSSPLYSNSIPGGATPTHNALVQMSYQNTAGRYSIYRLNGTAITGGLLLEREYSNANYFTVAQQGRFAHMGFTALPDRPYTGKVFLVNLIALMDNY